MKILLILCLCCSVFSQLRFRAQTQAESEPEFIYGFFMATMPVNFLVWSPDSGRLKPVIEGTVGYSAVFLFARGGDSLRNCESIVGVGVGTVIGYGTKPVLGIVGVIQISQINTFLGYDFLSRKMMVGVGYTVLIPFPSRAFITLYKRRVK